MADKLDLDLRHPLWQRYAHRWTMASDFYRGGIEVLQPEHLESDLSFAEPIDVSEGSDSGIVDPSPREVKTAFRWVTKRTRSYLFTHPREKESSFISRAERTAHVPVLSPIIDAYVAGVTKNQPKRAGQLLAAALASPWAAYLQDVTGDAESIDEFVKRAIAISMYCGRCHAITDRSGIDSEPVSRLHEQAAGIRTFSQIVTPLQLINWSVDRFGEFNWIVYREFADDMRAPGEEFDAEAEQWKVWTRDKWMVYRRLKSGAFELHDEREHGLGLVPLSTMWHKRGPSARQTLSADPFAPDLLDIDRSIFNKMSLLDQIDYNQTFSILAVPGHTTGAGLDIGIFDAIAYDGASGIPAFISPDPSMASGLWVRIKELFQVARNVSGISRGISELSKEARSRAALNFESEEKFSIMSMIAANAAEFERELFAHVAEWESAVPISSEYSQQFDVLALETKLDNILKIQESKVPFNALKPLLRGAVAEALKRVGASDADTKMSLMEIDNAKEPDVPVPSMRKGSGGAIPGVPGDGVADIPSGEE